jgi:hypothetical protein
VGVLGRLKIKNPATQGGALKPKFSKPKTQTPNQVRDDKTQEENPVVMLNLFQHPIKAFLPLADTSFIPVPAYRQAGTGRGFQMRS